MSDVYAMDIGPAVRLRAEATFGTAPASSYAAWMTGQPDDGSARNLLAERERAAAEGRPFAVPIECGLEWDVGAPLPTILQWEHEAHVFFFLRGDGDRVGTIVFADCMASTFGPPGEEGHGLQGSGWEAYTPLQVMNSPWPGRMFAEPAGLNHFVLSFHDRTFECLAHSFAATRVEGTMSEAVQAVVGRWR